MKISRISVFQVDLPLSQPYFLSGGRLRYDVLDATFVQIETDAGITGWGEGTPWGHTYVPAHGRGIRAGIETMAPFIMGLDPREILTVGRAMDIALPGHFYAKSPIDLACWDIAGQEAGRSIASMLGGRRETGTRIMSSVSSGTPDYMLNIIKDYRKIGYSGHSVKVGGDAEKDIERITFLEKNRLPGERILYDVNRAWTRREASIVMNATAHLGVSFEQPCETLDDIEAVRRLTTSPISVDESLVTTQDAARIARDGIAEIFGIKLNRVGGLTKAVRMRDIALAHDIQIYVMATGGSILADTEAAILAATIPDHMCLGTWACQDMLTVDIAPKDQGSRNQNGHLFVSGTPGHGITPNEDKLGDPVAIYS